jgi:hypothetical protein
MGGCDGVMRIMRKPHPAVLPGALGGEDKTGVFPAILLIDKAIGKMIQLSHIVCTQFTRAVEKKDEGIGTVFLLITGNEQLVWEGTCRGFKDHFIEHPRLNLFWNFFFY